MKFVKIMICAACALLCSIVSAADRLAVAEPVGTGSVQPDDLKVLWNMLEASISSKNYELITRGSLQSMLTEIGLTDSSGLVNLNSNQKAKLGQLKTVNCILISKLGKSGARFNLSLMVMDASTGTISDQQKASVTANSMQELSDKLKSVLLEMGIGAAPKRYGRIALIAPVVLAKNVPVSMATKLNTDLENSLINGGLKLQNLKSVNKILAQNGIGNLAEAEPALYFRVGELLQVDELVQVIISRFSFRSEKKHIEVTQQDVVRQLGDLAGTVRIISTQTGSITGAFTFKQHVDFAELDDDTSDWTEEDFCDYLIDQTLPTISKQLLQTLKK